MAQISEPVTWLVSVRNGMPFVRQTLQSIAEQTYRNHSILVWDDASNDGTLRELEAWIPSRIPGKITTGASFNIGANRAFLMTQAKTELCAWVDGDDVNAPTRLEKQVAHMLAHPEVVALGTQLRYIDPEGKPLPGKWIFPCDDAEARWRSRWFLSVPQSGVMVRRPQCCGPATMLICHTPKILNL